MGSIVRHNNWKFNFENDSVYVKQDSRWIKIDLAISDLFDPEGWVEDYEFRDKEVERDINSESFST